MVEMDYKHTHTDTDTSSGTHHHIDTQIHITEQDAYYHVLRAFQAQSHALTWEKEALITQLRKELRLSDEEHRHLLARVNNDAAVSRIREWRKAPGPTSSHPIHDSIPSPTPCKKQKTGHSAPSAVHPPPSVFKRGPSPKKSKGMPHPPAAHPGRPLNANRGSSTGARKPAEANFSLLIGKKVWTRWPDDNNFYEAEITEFKEGNHALVYDKDTPNETWEWVDFKEIRPQDIRWEGDDPGVLQRGSSTGQGRGMKKPNVRGGAVNAAGRGRGTPKGMPKKDLPRPQNGIGIKGSADIELLHTDTLIKEVEQVFSRSHPDPTDIEKAKTILKVLIGA